MYKDMVCRLCKKADETLDHVVNCGSEEVIDSSMIFANNVEFTYERKLLSITIASRISRFMEEIKEEKKL